VSELARFATESECGVFELWKHGKVFQEAAERDRYWVGEERAKVFVGCEERVRRGWLGGATEFGRVAASGVSGEDKREGDGGERLGPTGCDSESRVGGWVRDSLRVELGVGGCVGRGAHGGVASVCRAEAEQGDFGGGNEGGFGGEEEQRRVSEFYRVGRASEGADGLGQRERD